MTDHCFTGWPYGGVGSAAITDVDSGATRSGRQLSFATPGVFRLNVVVTGGDYALVPCFAWGAGGGGYSGAGGSRKGGGGGFGRGLAMLRTGPYCVVVGSPGLTKGDGAGQAVRGHGGGGLNAVNGYGGSGGGLTGIFSGFAPLIGMPLLLAGGGGGAGYTSDGGPGGGTTGGNSADGNATGGTQTAPGSPPSYGLSGALPGSAYQGWSSNSNTDGGGGGGGGGGLFGGGSGANNTSDGGAGGGSGFAHPIDVLNALLLTGAADVAAGGSEALYPGSSTVGTGGAPGADGKRGHLILVY